MEKTERKGITGSVLKWIAVASMFLDHAAASLIEEGAFSLGSRAMSLQDPLFLLDLVLRAIGRLAFPIYCFLLAEGYRHTRDVRKYLLRLLAFGLVSEIPFDLVFKHRVLEFSYQNVYFTLLLGLLAIHIYQCVMAKGSRLHIPALLAAAPWVAAAFLLHTDYGAWGAGLILALHVLRDRPAWRNTAAALLLFGSSPLEIFGYPDFLLFHRYNGERGRQPKYFFYLFYPAHLLLLVLVRIAIFGTY